MEKIEPVEVARDAGPGEDVTADVTGEADGAAEPTDGDSTPGITRTLSEGSDAVVLSVRRLSNIVQMLVDMNSAAVKDDSQLDLRTAAKLMGQLLLVRLPLHAPLAQETGLRDGRDDFLPWPHDASSAAWSSTPSLPQR
jgi:hypothetical protein